MKQGMRYALATFFVAAIVAPYVGYMVRGTMPFIQDERGMAGTGLVLAAAAVVAAGREAFGDGRALRTAVVLGAVTFGLGLAAVWLEWNSLVLMAFIAAVVAFWAFEALRLLAAPTAHPIRI